MLELVPLVFDDDDGRIEENEGFVNEEELLVFEEIKAEVGLWLNGTTKRNLPIPSFFDKLS